MSALDRVINEMTDPFWDEYDDIEPIWGKPSNTLLFGDFREAAAELAALRARVAELEELLSRTEGYVGYFASALDAEKKDVVLHKAIMDALDTRKTGT